MSTTNHGNQTQTFQYKQLQSSQNYNKLLRNILNKGIYNGGGLALDGTNPTDGTFIQPFTILVPTPSGELVKVSTDASVDMNAVGGLSIATPYIVCNYTWIDAVGNYLDFVAKDLGSIDANDVVFGKAIYSGANIVSYDSTYRSLGKPVNELFIGDLPFIVKGGNVSQGTGDTLNIVATRGILKYYLDGALRAVEVDFSAQTDLVISSANLDGVTPNYVKVVYHPTVGYQIVVNDTSTLGDETEIELATFVGTTGGVFTFSEATKTTEFLALNGMFFRDYNGATPFGFTINPDTYDATTNILKITSTHDSYSGVSVEIAQGNGIDPTKNYVDVKSKQVKNLLPPTDRFDAVPKIVTDEIDAKANIARDQSDGNSLKILDLSLQTSYLMGRKQTGSDLIIEPFFNKTQTADEGISAKPAIVMDETDFNNNWKSRNGSPDYKNGLLKQPKDFYRLEVMDQYDLTGVGQDFKGGMSQYDSINECYWLMTESGSNTVGQILKVSPKMVDGKVQVLASYYLPATGANQFWRGLDSDGTRLFFIGADFGTVSSSDLYSILINTDGTLGEAGFEVSNGGTIDLASSIENKITCSAVAPDVGYYQDVVIYDSTNIMVSTSVSTNTASILGFVKTTLAKNTAIDITNIGSICPITTNDYIAMTKDSNFIYFKVADLAEQFIYRLDIVNDIDSSRVLYKHSGRFEGSNKLGTDTGNSGISISKYGELLDVVSNQTSGGRYIAKRALKSGTWSENQVSGMLSQIIPSVGGRGCMIEANRYYWTGDSASANLAKIRRYDKTDGTSIESTLIGQNWTHLFDLATDGTTVWLVGFDGVNVKVFFGLLSDLITDMANATVTLGTTWGMLASGVGSSNTSSLNAMGYDADDDIVYLANDTSNTIDTLSKDGVTWTQGVKTLPNAIDAWQGLAVKNGKFYLTDKADASGLPDKIRVFDKVLLDSVGVNAFEIHAYQDSSRKFDSATGSMGIDFDGNDLIQVNQRFNVFTVMKVLEDPDVQQIHTFINSGNVLLSNAVLTATPIADRYFSPEDFADPRDVPDKQYMAVGYGDNGFSILHLDEYFADKSSTGKERYDVRKIRTQHFNSSTNNMFNIHTGGANHNTALSIENDIILAVTTITSTVSIMNVIDLKSGRCTYLGSYLQSGISGRVYSGSISERNAGRGSVGATNTELYLSINITNQIINKLHSRTFTKEDASDYQGENPKTFVAIGHDGGTDLLVIDWDSNGNRTAVKVWNNIFDNATTGVHAVWIAPSGYVFSGNNLLDGTMSILTEGVLTNKKIFVWDVASDNIGRSSIGVLNGAVRDIAPNSRCWKLPSGQWRHELLVGTHDVSTSSGYDYSLSLVDVENGSIEPIKYTNTTTNITDTAYPAVDLFEDSVFAVRSINVSFTEVTDRTFILQKNRFINGQDFNVAKNGWSQKISNDAFSIGQTTRPFFQQVSFGTTGVSRLCRYSPNSNTLAVGNTLIGLQLLHFSNQNNAVHESKIIELTENPSRMHYLQNAILPSADKILTVVVNDVAVSYTNGSLASWSVTPSLAEIARDGTTEGFLEWTGITGKTGVGINFLQSDNAGGATITVTDTTSATIVPDWNAVDISLFYDDGSSGEEDLTLWVDLPDSTHSYSVRIEHNGENNVGGNDYLKVSKFFTKEPLTDSKVDAVVRLTHSGHVGYSETYPIIEIGKTQDIIKTVTLASDGVLTLFELTATTDRASSVIRFGHRTTAEILGNSAINWLHPYDPSLSWGSNIPNFDDEIIDSNGHFGVLYDVAPVIGEVYIEFTPKSNQAELLTTIKQPTDGVSFTDAKPNIRLLDHALETIK